MRNLAVKLIACISWAGISDAQDSTMFSVPFSTNKSSECVSQCIDRGLVFCETGTSYGLCCREQDCGRTLNCSNENENMGAKYATCVSDLFCGQRDILVGKREEEDDEVEYLVINDPDFSPGSACNYEFRFPNSANFDHHMKIEVVSIENADLYYSEGISRAIAVGKRIRLPSSALFTVSYPDSFYLTVLNKDLVATPFESIKINYWYEEMEVVDILRDQDHEPTVEVSEQIITVSHQDQFEMSDESIMTFITAAIAALIMICISAGYCFLKIKRDRLVLQ